MLTNLTDFTFMGGLDRSILPLRADRGTFYDLLNFRHHKETRGYLEQTPFFNSSTLSQGTYYNAGSQTEPATSSILLVKYGLTMTDYVIRGSSNQVQTFYQTTYPAAETIYTGLRLVVNSTTGFGINLGSTIDVEMTGAATFRWRKNGGGYTAGLVPSTAGVSIDGGNATLYFLANGGYAGTETWSWTRLDRSYGDGSYTSQQKLNCIFYKGDAYFTATDHRIMVMTDNGNQTYAISLGYRPVYGSYLVVYDDHLVIGLFSKTVGYYYSGRRLVTVGWSDKTDLHNFIPTDTNEADSVELAFNLYDDGIGITQSNFSQLGLAVLKQRLYVITSNGIFTTDALGLPLVFSFGYNEFPELLYSTQNNVVVADKGIYLVGAREVYFFDGVNINRISAPIEAVDATGFASGFGTYDKFREELLLCVNGLLYGYQEKYQTWYTRSASFTRALTTMQVDTSQRVVFAGGYLTKYTEDLPGTGQPAMDASSGASYATPKLTTQLVGHSLREVKEFETVFIGAQVYSTNIDATYYSTDTNLQVKVGYYTSTDGRIAGSVNFPSANNTWTNASPDGHISLPRVPARALAVELQLIGLVSNKPPYRAYLTAAEPLVKPPGVTSR